MAKISNTTSYPQVVPSLDDYVIGTHIAGTPTNQTTNFKISDIKTAIGADTLQEVLDAGNVATQDIVLTGDITLTDASSDLLMNGGNIEVQTNNLDILGTNPGQELFFNFADRIRGLSEAISFVSSGDATLVGAGELTLDGGGGVVISTNGAPILGNDIYIQSNQNISLDGDQIGIGAVTTLSLEVTGVPTSMELAGGIITTGSIFNLNADNGLTLAGVSGAAGEVPTSQGPGLPLVWTVPPGGGLPPLPATEVWVGDAANVATSTSLVSVNLASSDIEIGSPTSKTTFKGTVYAPITFPYGTNNTGYGLNSMSPFVTGEENTTYGVGSGANIDTGNANTIVGYDSGTGFSDRVGNTLIGHNSQLVDTATSDEATAVGRSSECDESGVAIGSQSFSGSGSVSIGAESSAENGCIAIGYSSNADVHPVTANPLINLQGALISNMVIQSTVYADNTAALAAGLKKGDVYLLDNTTIGIAAVGAPGGPAILCAVYEI